MRTLDDRTSVRVMQRDTGHGVPRVPLVNHQRRRTWSHVLDPLVQFRKSVGDRQSWRYLPYRIAQPIGRTLQAVALATSAVDHPVRQRVRMPRDRHRRISPE